MTGEQTAQAVFAFSPEQHELRAVVRKFLLDRSPESEVRRLMETEPGYDPSVWALLAENLGLPGLLIPERFGGAGSGFVELQIVCEEMGRALLCAPYFSSAVLATGALLEVADEAADERYLPGLAAGTLRATLAISEAGTEWAADRLDTVAVADGDRFRLTGEKLYVLDGASADLLLVVARTGSGPGLFAVEAGADGLRRTPMTTLDATRKQARIELADTPSVPVGVDGQAAAPIAAALSLAAAALAAEQAGGARRTLEMAVDYARVREQFGRPIGSYQAIKHKCADMLLEVESSVSVAYAAGWAVDTGSDEAPLLASMAKAYCSEAYYHCAAENIQVHGGIGFTWEHPAHLYFKRARSSQALLGSPRYHRELLAGRLEL
ncbi:MAG TPA: acyl-CoA dehydrogenase family protein [Pseudonocardia sp.]|uniref:acyl-CoA dehydrogenase family protein n=1 Tax=Pseudonocardia sp. TaxID=60912 RepID=UPI002F404C3E